jgi:flagellar biosynthesis protein FlhA
MICAWEPPMQAAWIKAVRKSASAVRSRGYQPVILCSEQARFLVKNSTEREIPELAVISVQEVTPDIIPEAVGIIRLEDAPSKEGVPSKEGGE